MFNITDKIYVEHINNYAGRFECILLDNGTFDDVTFQHGYEPLAIYDSLATMLQEEYDNDVKNFFDFLKTKQKLKIFVTEEDYLKLYAYVIAELFQHVPHETYAEVLKKFLQLADMCEYLQSGKNINISSQYQELTLNHVTSGLYSLTNVEAIPLDFAMFLFDNKAINETQMNNRIMFLAKPLLESFLISLIQLVKKIITRNPQYLQDYLGVTNIVTLSDIQEALKGDRMLNNLFGYYHLDMIDLDDIMKLYTIALTGHNRPVDIIDLEEMKLLFEFYQTPTVTLFKANIQNILESQFFSRRFEKFNDLLLESVVI